MISPMARTAKKIAVAAVKAFGAEGIIIQQFEAKFCGIRKQAQA
jgi:hypothetical protein